MYCINMVIKSFYLNCNKKLICSKFYRVKNKTAHKNKIGVSDFCGIYTESLIQLFFIFW